MKKTSVRIINGKLVTPHQILEHKTLWIEEGKIARITETVSDAEAEQTIDARGHYVAPGFIDMHVHGGGGADFMDGTVEAFLKIAETHAKHGTTSLMPTTLTSEKEELYKLFDTYKEAEILNTHGAEFLGIHLEGPYFCYNQRGAQDPRYLRNPDPAEYNEILNKCDAIKRWSVAPELPGAIEFGQVLRNRGIIASIAHTEAVYEEVVTAFENGYSLVTHLYSGMTGVTRRNAFRYAGVVESAYLLPNMDVEIIADGVHLPAPLLRLIYQIKGAGHIALTTDAMRGAGMPEGPSILGGKANGLPVIIEDGVAKLPDRSSFAGSVATGDRLVRTMISQAGVSLPEAVRMITHTPARILGIENSKGTIDIGKDADLVIFDNDINICETIINGKLIYQR